MNRTADQIREKLSALQMPVERQALVTGILAGSEAVRYGMPVEIERGGGARVAPNGEAYHVRIAASTETIARDAGIVPIAAWERGGLTNFVRNPVILAFHSHRDPIGISVFTELSGEQLIEYWRFHEQTQLSRELKALYEGGWLRAASVGFIVTEFAFIDELPKDEYEKLVQKYGASNIRDAVWIAKRAELLETSAVPVPSDPNALQFSAGMRNALACGIDVSEIQRITKPEVTRMPDPNPVPASPEPQPEPKAPERDPLEVLTERVAGLETELRGILAALTERVAALDAPKPKQDERSVDGGGTAEPMFAIEVQEGETKDQAVARFVDQQIALRLGAPTP